MIIATIELKWNEFRQNILNQRNKRRNDQLSRVNSIRERSIKLLQQRYGYTKEKADSELKKHYSKTWLG